MQIWQNIVKLFIIFRHQNGKKIGLVKQQAGWQLIP